MPRSTIIFRVPQNFEPLIGPVSDFPGMVHDRIDYNDLDNLDSQLRSLIGEVIEFEFDEPHDPSAPIDRFIEALKASRSPYLACHDSYTEPARGTRFEARILVSTSEFTIEKPYRWVEGEPDIADSWTFRRAGGFDEYQIMLIEETFFPERRPAPQA